jgi:membrane AbrB-like protein
LTASSGNLTGILKTLIIGAVGGVCFFYLHLPLPWMLGSMFAVAMIASTGFHVAMSPKLRAGMVAILGTLLGSSFSPGIVDQVGEWLGGVIVTTSFVAVMTAVCVMFFLRAGRFDPVTAYFSGTPGGLAMMTIVGEEQGGNQRTIPLVHATRVFIVVFAVPMYMLLVEGVDVPRGAATLVVGMDIAPVDFLILASCALVGWLFGLVLNVTGGQIIMPMVVSAAAYMSGIIETPPPAPLVAIAQVVMGAGIGVRFVGIRWREAGPSIAYAALSALIMLSGALVVAHVTAPLIGVEANTLVLALAPGGLAEMCMTALVLNADTAFIATMHVVRILMIVALAPFVFRLLGWQK